MAQPHGKACVDEILRGARASLLHPARTLVGAGPWVVAGAVLGSVPTGLLMNFCAGAFVEGGGTWDAAMLAASWSDETIRSMETPAPALLWIFWSGFTFSLMVVPGLCLAHAWGGAAAASACRSVLFAACVWAPALLAAVLPGLLILARALSVQGQSLIGQALATYNACQLWVCCSLPAYLILGGPAHARARQKGSIFLTFLLIFVVIHLELQLVLRYWIYEGARQRLAIVVALVVLRAVSETGGIRLALSWPRSARHCREGPALVLCSFFGAIIQSPCYFLQAGTGNIWASVGVSLVLACAEVARNLCYLNGTSPLDRLLTLPPRCWRRCRERCGAETKVFSESSIAHGEMFASLYPKRVPLQNYLEVIVLSLVFSLKLTGKLSPDEVGGEPDGVSFTMSRFAIAIAFEAATGFFTAALARRWQLEGHLEFDAGNKSLCCITQVCTCVVATTFLINFQCPQTDATGKLRSVSQCSPRSALFGGS